MPSCYVQTTLSWQQPAQIKTAGIWAAIPVAEGMQRTEWGKRRLDYSPEYAIRVAF